MIKFSVQNILLKEVGERIKYPVKESLTKVSLPEDIGGKTLSGKVVFTKLEETVLAELEAKAEVVLICDRCLSNFDKTLEISLAREYNINRQDKNEENLFVDKYGDVDLEEPIREEIILAVPMKNLCREDCAGICPKCGVNLNIEEHKTHNTKDKKARIKKAIS
jgi:uncharacterized protein